MSKLSVPSQQELMLARVIRQTVLAELQSRRFGNEQLARVLDIFPSGAGGLLRETDWPLEIAVRVADALGINITESLGRDVA
jgi:hypothetical protein